MLAYWVIIGSDARKKLCVVFAQVLMGYVIGTVADTTNSGKFDFLYIILNCG